MLFDNDLCLIMLSCFRLMLDEYSEYSLLADNWGWNDSIFSNIFIISVKLDNSES